MKRNFLFEGFLVLAFLFLQSYTSMAAWFNLSKSLEGTIQEIHSNLITIAQNSSNPTEASLTKIDIEVNNDTKYTDLNSVTELKQGDLVQIKYKEEEGKKVALEVAKITPQEENSSVSPYSDTRSTTQ